MNAAELLKQRDQILDEYEKSVGLPQYVKQESVDELEKYLNLDRDVIEKLDADNCASISYRLSGFGFNLQRAQNRENSRISWAKNEIKQTIAPLVNNYKGYSYEERAAQAIKENEHASKLNSIMMYAQQRADRLNFLSRSIQNMSDILKAMMYNKGKNND